MKLKLKKNKRTKHIWFGILFLSILDYREIADWLWLWVESVRSFKPKWKVVIFHSSKEFELFSANAMTNKGSNCRNQTVYLKLEQAAVENSVDIPKTFE